jgi:gluconate kinase|tara:strand:- start:346 stop:564 length:219 start_codon:yes stop_codon:yes gene_type:complete
MMRLYRVYAARENEEDVFGVAAEKKERELLCKKNRSPAFVYTLYIKNTLQTQRKKNRRPHLATLRFGVKYNE